VQAPGAAVDEAAAISVLLGAQPARRSRRTWVAGLLLVGLVLAAVAGLAIYGRMKTVPESYSTTPVRRGDLSVQVTVTGSLAPVNQVDVGSELSGTIETVAVEENDRVRRGQVLATLDTARLHDQLSQAEASLASAEAGLAQAQATVQETRLKAERLHRLLTISSGGWPAQADVDAADAALARAQAAERSARAGIVQARANLSTGRTNLGKAVIRSPVDGVVLTRKAEPGQTVAASLQAPVLFTLAEDMRRMELHADIDEADVGQVKEGQAATFTVDAYPGRDYQARVTRVGLGSQVKEGVISYTGVLSVDNADLSLRPGMTASADIRTVTRQNVLLVPEAALRYTPPETQNGPGLSSALVPRMPRLGRRPVRRSADATRQQIWVLQDGRPTAVNVRVGASDGRETEVSGAGLRTGMQVITDGGGAAR
jgi:HlyD family secretion protein